MKQRRRALSLFLNKFVSDPSDSKPLHPLNLQHPHNHPLRRQLHCLQHNLNPTPERSRTKRMIPLRHFSALRLLHQVTPSVKHSLPQIQGRLHGLPRNKEDPHYLVVSPGGGWLVRAFKCGLFLLTCYVGTPAQIRGGEEVTLSSLDESKSRRKNTPGDQSMRRSIQDLVSSIDPNVKIEPEVEDVRTLTPHSNLFTDGASTAAFVDCGRVHRLRHEFRVPPCEASRW
jgi:hypothetical protein